MSEQRTTPAGTSDSGAAVRFPLPPLLFLAPLAATLAIHRRWPRSLPVRLGTSGLGVSLTVAGVAFSVSGAATVVRHRTTLVPHHPVSALVSTGPFRFSRNPMYTGQAVAYVGAALWAGSWWPLPVAPLCVLATDRLVVRAEEEYLSRRFGEAYNSYRSRVRRWL